MALLISMDRRTRMLRGMTAGNFAREVARQFNVAPPTASRLKKHVAATGSIEPRPPGQPKGYGKLGPYKDFLIGHVLKKPDITMPQLEEILQETHGVKVDPSNISKLLCAEGFTYKKALLAAEQERADVKAAPGGLEALSPAGDSGSTGATCVHRRNRGEDQHVPASRAIPPRHAPEGRRGWTQTFIAGLRCGALTAPWIVEGAMNRAAFDIYVETQLAPPLSPGDVVILDNLSVHQSQRAADVLAARGAWFLFLPKYSPDLNPIEMAVSKLKAHLRAASARTFEDLTKAIGDICALFTPTECWNFFKAANYVAE